MGLEVKVHTVDGKTFIFVGNSAEQLLASFNSKFEIVENATFIEADKVTGKPLRIIYGRHIVHIEIIGGE